MRPKLRRVREKGWIGGVCAGFGYWLGIPTWLIRIVWVVMVFSFGFGILAYLLFWIFMPAWEIAPADYDERAGG